MTITKHGDIGTKLLKQKGLKIFLIDGQHRARRSNISPVDTMYNRGYLTIAQLSGAQELYRHWITAWGENGSCAVVERVDGGGKEREMTTRQIHSIREFKRGKDAMKKLKTWEIIDKVVINEISPTTKGTGESERKRTMFWLRMGLDNLAKVYGFA